MPTVDWDEPFGIGAYLAFDLNFLRFVHTWRKLTTVVTARKGFSGVWLALIFPSKAAGWGNSHSR